MPLTFCYKIGPIDLDRLAAAWPGVMRFDENTGERAFSLGGFHEQVAAARAAGELTIPTAGVSAILAVPGEPGCATVNFGRVRAQDPADPRQLAAAEQEGRRQIAEGAAFFRKTLPGFERIRVLEIARQIGVRESRQIEGLHTLTGGEARSCRQFDDAVAQCCYAIDVHHADDTGTTLIPFEPGTHFDIPWRCLVPRAGPGNLVVGGRCISADQEAMSAFRVAPSVMAIGEAAGVTAALAAGRGITVDSVSPGAVRARLMETGGILL